MKISLRYLIGILGIIFAAALGVHGQTNTFPTTGNAGIGTISPGALLDVNNGGGGSQALSVVGGGSTASTAVFTTNFPAISSGGANYVRDLGFYSWNLPITSGVTDSGYRVGLDIENFVTDSSFLGTSNSQFGLWARVGPDPEGSGGPRRLDSGSTKLS